MIWLYTFHQPITSSTPTRSEIVIRYSLWSHDHLLGHTDLDMPCVNSFLMQGFIEPTAKGSKLLPRATGVARVTSAPRGPNLSKAEQDGRAAEFLAACWAREALELELRLEDGTVFPCDFIRVWDLRDDWWNEDPVDDGEPLDPETQAEIDAEVAAWEESRRWGSAWPPPIPPDPRWDTMQYFIQVYLERADDIDDLLASSEFDDF